jgi:phosphoglycolate phosphatase
MRRAFDELWGASVRDVIESVPFAGRTDAWIVSQVAARMGVKITSSDLHRFREIYLQHLPSELEQPGPRKGIMPGVRELLDALHPRPDVHLALLTGNFKGGAKAKLEYFDLWRYFCGGGFGDVALDRNHLVSAALEAVVAAGGPALEPSRSIVIGDTPLDVACAASAGAGCVAVATGGYDPAALRAAGADIVFENLSETAAVVAEIERLAGGE